MYEIVDGTLSTSFAHMLHHHRLASLSHCGLVMLQSQHMFFGGAVTIIISREGQFLEMPPSATVRDIWKCRLETSPEIWVFGIGNLILGRDLICARLVQRLKELAGQGGGCGSREVERAHTLYHLGTSVAHGDARTRSRSTHRGWSTKQQDPAQSLPLESRYSDPASIKSSGTYVRWCILRTVWKMLENPEHLELLNLILEGDLICFRYIQMQDQLHEKGPMEANQTRPTNTTAFQISAAYVVPLSVL
ncbi:hypothetical protein IW261DRAFT_1416506 [Armillaria novae-zelandiae]|uniref:Uncharacterized protein n=1 Tax=Armillaria novae-zelandiae TaxID=153914 RepID=A0AA39UIW7_9AGAR|nr:hypothetical protein IW261DRAFT_1416506 [Armillaria novae-zelandiae]